MIYKNSVQLLKKLLEKFSPFHCIKLIVGIKSVWCWMLGAGTVMVTMMIHSPGNHQARAADGGAQWRARRCSGRRASRSARTSTATCRCCDTAASWTGSIWGKKSILLFNLAPWDMRQNASCLDYVDTYFSNRFIRFCHGVCLICFRDIFRPSSETLAVTVTEIISN